MRSLDLQESLDQRISSPHIRTSFMDAPEVTNSLFKEVRRSHEVTRVRTEFLLLNVENLLGLLNAIACFLVGISVRYLVLSTTVNLNFAALASKKMFCAATDRAA